MTEYNVIFHKDLSPIRTYNPIKTNALKHPKILIAAAVNEFSKEKSDRLYWQRNLKIIGICLFISALSSFGFGVLLRPWMPTLPWMTIDLGFWFAQQGSIITFVFVVFFYAWKMNKIDSELDME
ncbi:DUF4212 domain-containing protein [Ruegeria arenilitoris]|uniref:DUF4212 domain-containing protein n=1 Tax=Ruegeria arenilitoris TaxID=1173585 RepID=UPI00147FAD15